MKTAEEIIQEYLDRGYSPESLRILAESREEPLGSQMLELLDRLDAPAAHEGSGTAEVACETGSYGRVDGDMVFFIAGDEVPADAESVDFDVMAETVESVADIVVGETDGADVVAYRTEAVEAVDAGEPAAAAEESVAEVSAEAEDATPDEGIWSRLWSKVAQLPAPVSAPAPDMPEEMEMAAALEVAPPETEAVAEEERPLFDESLLEEVAAGAEISADYLPGFVTEEAIAEEPLLEEAAAEAPAAGEAPVPAVENENKTISRREKRRRERLEKKKARRGKKNAEDALPEIVLTRSEETDTLVPELLPELVAETAQEVGREAAAETERAVGILTPIDIVAAMEEEAESPVAPETLAALSVHSYALSASLVAMSRSELAKAAALIEQDRAAALAIEQNNAEAVLENAGEETFEDAAEETAGESGNNVILFSDKFPVFAGEDAGGEDAVELSLVEDDEEENFEPCLRVLPAPSETEQEADSALIQSCEVTEEAARQLLLTASEPETEAEAAPAAEAEPEPDGDTVLLEYDAEQAVEESEDELFEEEPAVEEPAAEEIAEPAACAEPEADPLEAVLERETALRLAIEEDYQTRLDDFAVRLLDAQTAAETKLAEKKAELDARTAVLEEMRSRLGKEEEKQQDLLRRLDEAAAAAQSKDGELKNANGLHEGLREEHGRLYAEFEDLRKAYNEVVTDVMPELQRERDDLAMTVERQCAKERLLRTSLGSSRKRLAAGYILGAAACLMLVTLPVANWLRSGEENKQLAVDHQLFSELRGTLDAQVEQNVAAQTRIVELERKITRARDEITRLDGRNKELAAVAQQQQAPQYAKDIAVFKPEDAAGGGTPTRAMTMALQATVPPGGQLHVNEVMDPAGSIEQLAMVNRGRNASPYGADARMAQGARSSGTALPISALVSTDTGSAAGSLRPNGGARPARSAAVARTASAAGADIVTAKVKKGEGVAQVVYRVLNTRDPDVIAWVIQENNVRSDRRGNPVIQPNQELRLPRDGRIGQAASAAGANRR